MSKYFDLMAAKLEEAKQDMIAQLNRELFRDAGPRIHVKPIPRWRRIWWRVSGYFSVLWLALKGADLEIRRDDYDW